jgi:hypothetical protein
MEEAANPHGCAIPDFPFSGIDIDRLFCPFPVEIRLRRQSAFQRGDIIDDFRRPVKPFPPKKRQKDRPTFLPGKWNGRSAPQKPRLTNRAI